MLLVTITDLLEAKFVDTCDNLADWQIRDPRQIVKAADLALKDWFEAASDAYLNGWVRPVNLRITNTTTGVVTIYPMELVPFIMPTGAATISLCTVAGDVITRVDAGKFITELGVKTAATGTQPRLVAGQLFSDYYYNPGDDRMKAQVSLARNLGAGDFCWLIRNGRTIVPTTGAVVVYDPLTWSSATAGRLMSAPAWDAATITSSHTTMMRRLLGTVGEEGGAYGTALSVHSADPGWALADIVLPRRFSHTTS